MAHSTNIISQVRLPGSDTLYEIHDAQAIHNIADLNLGNALIFKGTKETEEQVFAITTASIGEVWLVPSTGVEYICKTALTGTADATAWEKMGNIHNAASTTHTHTISSLTGTNKASTVSGSASITNAPKVSVSAKYAKVSTGNDTFVKSYPGASSKMVTTSIKPAGTAATVISEVTPSTGSVTGVSGSVTASKATAGTAIAVAKAGSAKSVPNVTSVGSASSWSFTVSNGTLTIAGGNGSAPTLGTAISITPAVSNGNITPYTFTDVTVPKAATSATTVVTGVSTDTTDVATVGTAVTVATGSLSSSGTGSSVLTGLGTASTAKALTSASLAAGTSTDGIFTGDDVTVETQTLTGTISGTAAAQTWTVGSGSTSGPKD